VSKSFAVGIVGARGYAGAELLSLMEDHPEVQVVYAGSRELAGEPVPHVEGLTFGSLDAEGVSRLGLDAIFLALPDGVGKQFVSSLGSDSAIIDISFDHRLDAGWAYGLPELFRGKIAGSNRIANPGCYATAMQLVIAPFVDDLASAPAVFGVSGYSGAGTTKSPKNDPENLTDNLIPYRLVGHNHEKEATHHLGTAVRFMPHVHPAFRGLIVTAHIPLNRPLSAESAQQRFVERYAHEPLIEIVDDTPELRDGSGIPGVVIGGIETSADGRNLVVVAAEDNLLKGAAVQAVQNLNLSLGIDEFTAIPKSTDSL